MPIKDPSIYPPYWKQFSQYIRFERAGNKCEACGVPNGWLICRGYLNDVAFWWDETTGTIHQARTGEIIGRARDYELNIDREVKIVLTVAHLDNTGGICDCKARTGLKCANPAHVKALCQACHLWLDLPKHMANRHTTIANRKDAERGLFADV